MELKLGSKHNIAIGIIKYLWVFIILPKSIQFVCFLFITAILINNRRIIIDNTAVFFLCGLVVQMLAIAWQTIFYNDLITTDRLFAAFNTTFIWIIGILLYCYALKNEETLSIEEIGKYMTINLIILSVLCLIYHFTSFDQIYILGHRLSLKREDYLSTGATTRFCGFMETVLGPSHLFCMAFPVAIVYIKKWKNIFLKIVLTIFFYWPIVESHSRIGIVVCLFVTALGIIYILYYDEYFDKKIMVRFILVILALIFLYSFTHTKDIYLKINELFNSREGSNNARFFIYRSSISYTIQHSPLIGVGIKYMLGKFPYGSHCTYIGIFFKSGIIGSLFFLFGFFSLIFKLSKIGRGKALSVLVIYMWLMYFGLLFFSDFDGSDWNTVLWFFLWGIVIGKTKRISGKPILIDENS